jgi:peptidyl-prolyl cis-trans isomerase D
MQIFRRLLGSKFGGVFAAVFLGLIALAFIAGDMTGTGGLGVLGPAPGEVARVGGQTLTTAELQSRTQMVFERQREEEPALTMDKFLADGGLRRVADELIATKALIAYGEQNGMRVAKALIDAEIARNPAFVDATGNFSETVFRQMLAQRNVSEAALREDITAQLLQQHLLGPIGAGARAPASMVPPYAAMLLEQRSGVMIAVPSARFAPKAQPTDAQLQAYYRANPGQFSVPEQRRLRYALVDLARFEAAATPGEADIAAAYKARANDYRSRQTRDLSQLILVSESAAKDAAAQAKAGQPLAQVAQGLGLAATRIDGVDQGQLAGQTSADIAKAAFAAAKGGIVGPVRSPRGWAVLRVEEVREIAGKTLDQARAELVPAIRTARQKELFGDFLNEIDGRLGEGMTLAEVAKAQQLTIVETPLVIRDGTALGNADFKPDEALKALLDPGFAASADDDPQIVAIKPDEQAALLAVGEVVAQGPPPFAQVKAAVQIAWALSRGAEQARKTATALAAALGKGGEPGAVMAKLGIADAPRETISARRADINQQDGKIPPPLEALFTIRTGTTRMVPMDRNQGFIVVRLDRIIPNDPNSVPQLLQSTRAGLSNVLGNEYARQFLAAIQQSLGVERNAAAIASVEAALRRANGTGE